MKSSKLGDIRQTASDGVEILRQLGTPGVQETLDKVGKMTVNIKELMEIMNSPGWVKNIENIRKISEDTNNSFSKLEDTFSSIKETGVIEGAKEMMSSVKKTIASFNPQGDAGQELKDMGSTFKEVLYSIKILVDEIRNTVGDSRTSDTIHELQQTVKSVKSSYQTIKKGVK